MQKQVIEFAVVKKDGIVVQIGRSSIVHPAARCRKENGIKQHEDIPKQKTGI